MQLNHLELFKKVIMVSNLNVVHLEPSGSNLYLIDNGLRMRLYETYSYAVLWDFLKRRVTPGTLLRMEDEFELSYFTLYIPERFLPDGTSPYLALGPFCETRKRCEDVHRLMQKNRLPDRLFSSLTSYFDALPLVGDLSAYECLIIALASGLFEEEYQLTCLPAGDGELFPAAEPRQDFSENSLLTTASIEERYSCENRLLSAVSAGDYNRAHELHRKLSSFYIEPRTENLLRNSQNFQIILNTLCRKAAEQAGVPPVYIDSLSRKLAIQINETLTEQRLKLLSQEIVHKYCLLVKNYAMKGYSSATKEIISYIDFHYTEELSLNFFSEKFSFSRTYLSALFKKETGSTLTDYIHQVRMRKAITLINSSSLPISTVATTCGYNDINYFIRIFKKSYGMAPKQYQKNILHSGV